MSFSKAYNQGKNAGKSELLMDVITKIELQDYSNKEQILKLLKVEANKVIEAMNNE